MISRWWVYCSCVAKLAQCHTWNYTHKGGDFVFWTLSLLCGFELYHFSTLFFFFCKFKDFIYVDMIERFITASDIDIIFFYILSQNFIVKRKISFVKLFCPHSCLNHGLKVVLSYITSHACIICYLLLLYPPSFVCPQTFTFFFSHLFFFFEWYFSKFQLTCRRLRRKFHAFSAFFTWF